MGTPTPPGTPAVLPDAHSASINTNRDDFDFQSSFPSLQVSDLTQLRGQLIGIARPIWSKVVESEARLSWLHDMVKSELVVRNLEAYAQSISACLRSDEMISKEEERKILMGVMRLKLKDERKHLDKMRRNREKVRK